MRGSALVAAAPAALRFVHGAPSRGADRSRLSHRADVRVAVRVPVAKALGVVDSAMEGDPVKLADCVPDGLPVDVTVAKGVRGGVGG